MGNIFECCNPKNVQPAYHSQDSHQARLKRFKTTTDIEDSYTFFNKLGSGSFGEVMKAEMFRGGIDCAVKIIKKSKIN